MNPALKAPLKFVLALAAVIALGIVLYIGAALNVYVIAVVVKLISAVFG
jgi:type IV secretory pathway VirB2 component (pilin)